MLQQVQLIYLRMKDGKSIKNAQKQKIIKSSVHQDYGLISTSKKMQKQKQGQKVLGKQFTSIKKQANKSLSNHLPYPNQGNFQIQKNIPGTKNIIGQKQTNHMIKLSSKAQLQLVTNYQQKYNQEKKKNQVLRQQKERQSTQIRELLKKNKDLQQQLKHIQEQKKEVKSITNFKKESQQKKYSSGKMKSRENMLRESQGTQIIEEDKKDYDIMIEKALSYLSQDQQNLKQINEKAERCLIKAVEQIHIIQSKTSVCFEALAFTYSTLVGIKCTQGKDGQEINELARKAVSIYNANEGAYFEEKIALLNNLALHYEKFNPKEAIKLFEQVLAAQSKFYSLNDERRALTLNNIACTYCEQKRFPQGLKYFNEGQKIAKKGSEIQCLIAKNKQFYVSSPSN